MRQLLHWNISESLRNAVFVRGCQPDGKIIVFKALENAMLFRTDVNPLNVKENKRKKILVQEKSQCAAGNNWVACMAGLAGNWQPAAEHRTLIKTEAQLSVQALHDPLV